jgi:hypothetical protein
MFIFVLCGLVTGMFGCTAAEVATRGTASVYGAQASKEYYSHTVEMDPEAVRKVARRSFETLGLTLKQTDVQKDLEWDASEQNYRGENTWRYYLETSEGSRVRLVLEERKGFIGVYPAGDEWRRVQFWSGGLPGAVDLELSRKLIQEMKQQIPDSKTAEGWDF